MTVDLTIRTPLRTGVRHYYFTIPNGEDPEVFFINTLEHELADEQGVPVEEVEYEILEVEAY